MEELFEITIKAGIVLGVITILEVIIQVLINRCDRKDMEDQ